MDDLFYVNECSSTNNEISSILLYNTSDFTALYTFCQTNGRGQYGNQWVSSSGKNLAYTLAIKKSSFHHSDFLFNYYTAICVQTYIANLTGEEVYIKWPNDIILKKKKIAGILIEKKNINQTAYFVTGIGINILQENFDEISNAGSILTQTGQRLNLRSFVEDFHVYFTEKLKNIPSEDEIMIHLNTHLFRKDQISVFEINGSQQNGIVRKAEKNGKICLELETGMQSFYLKEVKLLY